MRGDAPQPQSFDTPKRTPFSLLCFDFRPHNAKSFLGLFAANLYYISEEHAPKKNFFLVRNFQNEPKNKQDCSYQGESAIVPTAF